MTHCFDLQWPKLGGNFNPISTGGQICPPFSKKYFKPTYSQKNIPKLSDFS